MKVLYVIKGQLLIKWDHNSFGRHATNYVKDVIVSNDNPLLL